jgi:serine protease Do
MRHAHLRQAISAGAILVAVSASVTPALGQQTPTDFTEIVSRMSPAVVGITSTREIEQQQIPSEMLPPPLAERFREQFPNQPQQAQALGSGFLIDEEGHIVTNNHVVQEATEIEVILGDGTTRAAELVGNDPSTDLAVLKVESTEGMAVARWGDSEAIQPGAWTIAIGSPFGLGGTVTVGVLSARSRDIQSGPYDDYLQTDASVNQGNSGGPLFDASGEVIGVTTAIVSPTGGSIGIGFAVPSRTAQRVVDELIQTGEVSRGFIGVHLQEISEPLARAMGLEGTTGALVADVQPGGPAEAAGIRSGDVIVGFEGQEIEGSRDLSFAVAERDPGDEVTLTVRRDGEESQMQLTLATREPEQQTAATAPSDNTDGDQLGVALAPIPDELKSQMGIDAEGGLFVQNVQPNSPAAESGLREGDVILEAGNQTVAAPRDLDAAWASARQEDRPLLLRVLREGGTSFVAVEG